MSVQFESDPRYRRQTILPGVGASGQEKLARSRVLVIGMGGLGSPVSLYLAAAGVGTLGLADHDRVETSNLHRQILHADEAEGRPKVESARARLLGINPGLKTEILPDGITPENAEALIRQYDLVVDGTDNFPTRYLINDAAWLTGTPLVYGSIFQFEGQVSVFDPASGSPCYRCLFPQPPEPGTVPNCAEAGVFGALCGIVGSWQASEAIKFILGLGEPLTGRIKVIDTLSGRDQLVSLKKDAACPLCGASPSITSIHSDAYTDTCTVENPGPDALPLEISLEEAAEKLRGPTPPLLLDVREDYERRICVLGDDLHIPTGEIQFKWDALPRDRHLLVYCHHGMRSLFVARFLHEKGFQYVQSLH
ncbi:MAG: molybdopterin-synthase adenylyltransferase MoeB, partial [Oceanipulchritudo sp.]